MDALAHCLEAIGPFITRSRWVGLEGMRFSFFFLIRKPAEAVKKALISSARNMLMASKWGTGSTRLGAIHRCRILRGCMTPSWALNGIVMPICAESQPGRLRRIERAAAISPNGGFDGFLKWILALRKIWIPPR